jgi:hypothetical protein
MNPVTLAPHVRGDTFVYSTTLEGGWTAEQFTGGLRFTLRKLIPKSSVVDDSDANVVAKASIVTGEIVATGVDVTVTIPASVAHGWPATLLFWDLQGVVNGVPNRVYTIAFGEISILADITRSS